LIFCQWPFPEISRLVVTQVVHDFLPIPIDVSIASFLVDHPQKYRSHNRSSGRAIYVNGKGVEDKLLIAPI
jgi:hypothetical protein